MRVSLRSTCAVQLGTNTVAGHDAPAVAEVPPPPFGLVDNEYSILNASDLVFIDPVTSGFSRPAKNEKDDAFFSDSADLDSLGEFIRLWTTRHERWLSPKWIARRMATP